MTFTRNTLAAAALVVMSAASATPVANTPQIVPASRIRIVLVVDSTVTDVRKLALDKKVPLVDLHERSIEQAERVGDAAWAAYSPRLATGTIDRTHLN
jgi:hypothetical protein